VDDKDDNGGDSIELLLPAEAVGGSSTRRREEELSPMTRTGACDTWVTVSEELLILSAGISLSALCLDSGRILKHTQSTAD
jgi:hypothetical protein